MGKDGEPGGGHTAIVRLPDTTEKTFPLSKSALGEELFAQVTKDLSIEEKDYFSLCFYDSEGVRHWLYNDKKIQKQLKDLPWKFSYEVKFYPTVPTSLTDDYARFNLFLQLKNDIYSGRLPATIATHAILGSLVSQAEFGDYQQSAEYENFLQTAKIAPNLNHDLIEKIKESHSTHKGLTPADAEMHYLDTCKQLAMYGVFLFNGKDSKSTPVSIGVCAHGINIYREQIRINRFSWQNIIKISYRKSTFSIKLKAGEIDKKETTVSFKLADYYHAKRVWKCAVEHHTFFRLMQPDDKPKGGTLFRFGSGKFRYYGRTQFQTKMASQMFDRPTSATVQRSQSQRISQSLDDVANKIPQNVEPSSPLNYADSQLDSQEMQSPTRMKSYDVSAVPTEKRKSNVKKEGSKKKKEKTEKKENADDSSSSSSSEDEKHEVVVHQSMKETRVTPQLLHYAPADDSVGVLVRQETDTVAYKITGSGLSPQVDPSDPSLTSTMAQAERLNAGRSPRLEHAERTVSVRAVAPLPVSFAESGQPHTTVASWNETSILPDEVVTEVDEHGNTVTRTTRTQQVKHTVQKQTFQNYSVPQDQQGVETVERVYEQLTPLATSQSSSANSPVVETHTRTVAYDANCQREQPAYEGLGEFVSSKTVTSGNRTVETITYKTERDGIIETHVEHRVTIHSDDTIDHDAELSQAILEATRMNPDMTVEKIEVKQESTN